MEVRSQARDAAEERRAAEERQRGGESRRKIGLGRPVRGGPPDLTWKIAVVDAQGNPGEVHLAPARTEPALVTVQVYPISISVFEYRHIELPVLFTDANF
jgi:hypothetical protein